MHVQSQWLTLCLKGSMERSLHMDRPEQAKHTQWSGIFETQLTKELSLELWNKFLRHKQRSKMNIITTLRSHSFKSILSWFKIWLIQKMKKSEFEKILLKECMFLESYGSRLKVLIRLCKYLQKEKSIDQRHLLSSMLIHQGHMQFLWWKLKNERNLVRSNFRSSEEISLIAWLLVLCSLLIWQEVNESRKQEQAMKDLKRLKRLTSLFPA